MAWVNWTTQFGTTTSTSDITISAGMEIEISGTAICRNLNFTDDGKLRFAPGTTSELQAWGYIRMRGTSIWYAQPSSSAVTHTVTIDVGSESNFQGASNAYDMDFKATDIGIWVEDSAQVIWAGTAKTPWVRLADAVSAGVTALPCESGPTGWQAGDQLVVTPMQPPTYSQHWAAYSYGAVTSVSGSTVNMDTPTAHAHLKLTGDHPPAGWTGREEWTARILNLTRNVVFQGKTGKNTHMLIKSNGAQTIDYVEARFVGPDYRTGSGDSLWVETLTARYPIHFHHGDAPLSGRHSVRGTVVHKSRNRAFVPHGVKKVDFNDCISHDVQFDAYWWDTNHNSEDILWHRCVASNTNAPHRPIQWRIHAFKLSTGPSLTLTCTECLAVGTNTRGGDDGMNSGFAWEEADVGNWNFHDNESFCNRCDGIFTWQNDGQHHDVLDTVCGWNGQAGIAHGAYVNRYTYQRMWLIGNRALGVSDHSAAIPGRRKRWLDISVEGKGITKNALHISHTNGDTSQATLCKDWIVRDITEHLVLVRGFGGANPQYFRLQDWDHNVTDEDLWFTWSSLARPETRIDVRGFTGQTEMFDLRRFDQSGTYVAAWNARKTVVLTDDFDADSPPGTVILAEPFGGANNAPWDISRWEVAGSTWGVTFDQQSGKGRMLVSSDGGSQGTIRARKDGDYLTALETAVSWTHQVSNTFGHSLTVGVRKHASADTYYGFSVAGDNTTVEIKRIVNGSGPTVVTSTWDRNTEANHYEFAIAGEAGADPVLRYQSWPAGTERPGGWAMEYTDTAAPSALRQAGGVFLHPRRSNSGVTYTVDPPLRIYDMAMVEDPDPPVFAFATFEWATESWSPFIAEGGTSSTLATSFALNVLGTQAYSVISSAAWLTATPTSGTVSNTTPVSVTVTANPAGLAPGVYIGFLSIASPGAIGDEIAVTLTVVAVATEEDYEHGLYYWDRTANDWLPVVVGGGPGGDVAAHAADTTGVHGIADTSALVLTDDARLSDARTPTTHSHGTGDITGLTDALAGKAATSHSHAISDTTGLQTALDGKVQQVVHGATGSTARPAGITMVIWVGTVEPANAVENDLWINPNG
jgi:hypothetical protein